MHIPFYKFWQQLITFFLMIMFFVMDLFDLAIKLGTEHYNFHQNEVYKKKYNNRLKKIKIAIIFLKINSAKGWQKYLQQHNWQI